MEKNKDIIPIKLNKWAIFTIGILIGVMIACLYFWNFNIVRNGEAADYFEKRMANVNHVVNDNTTIGHAKYLYSSYRFISRYFLEREVNLMCGSNYENLNQTEMDNKLLIRFEQVMEQCQKCGVD